MSNKALTLSNRPTIINLSRPGALPDDDDHVIVPLGMFGDNPVRYSAYRAQVLKVLRSAMTAEFKTAREAWQASQDAARAAETAAAAAKGTK